MKFHRHVLAAASALLALGTTQAQTPGTVESHCTTAEVCLAQMTKLLAAKGYHYQYLFVRNAKHVDRPTVAQTMPAALEWLWKGYPIP